MTDPTHSMQRAKRVSTAASTQGDIEKQKALRQQRLNRVLVVTREVVTIGATVIGAAVGIKNLRTPKR